MAVQITLYLKEGDEYKGRPLHLQLLKMLQEEKIENAVVLHGVAGFIGGSRIKTSSLVDAGGKLPLVLIFVDEEPHIERVLPRVKEMAGNRMIARENVVIESGALRP
jgi:PII-like signaling protein